MTEKKKRTEFEVYLGGSDVGEREWRWRLRAENGEIIASGEGYKEKRSCMAAIDLVKATSPDTRVQVFED